MASVMIVRDEDRAWQKSFIDREAQAGPTKEGLLVKRILPSAAGMPSMQRVRFDPGYIEPIHSHPDDEVITIVTGSIAFGRELLAKGDTLYVPRNTKYSLRTGEDGVEFIRIGMPQSDT